MRRCFSLCFRWASRQRKTSPLDARINSCLRLGTNEIPIVADHREEILAFPFLGLNLVYPYPVYNWTSDTCGLSVVGMLEVVKRLRWVDG